jgi:alkylation response protein AidB-like acyl-CoA dehydrogenase
MTASLHDATQAGVAAPPNLLYSQDEDDLRASLRALLTDRCPPQSVIRRIGTGSPHDRQLWHALARGLGLAGLLVPESAGGAGAGPREAAVVLEELGRSVAPVPFLASAVLATTALLAAAPDDELVSALASGTSTAVLLLPITLTPGQWAAGFASVDGGRLRGRTTVVADAEVADVLLVPAGDETGARLFAVPASAAGVAVLPRESLDSTRRLAEVTVDLPMTGARLVATGETVTSAVDRALLVGAGLLASEQVGVAQWCLDTTVDHVKQRYQFARPVGSFQAVKHRLADLWLKVSQARAAARFAADALASGSADAEIAVAVAASFCSQVAVHAAEECIQLHGGIGMTWEHPAHLYLKRAKSSQLALGAPGRHRAVLAGLVDLPPA